MSNNSFLPEITVIIRTYNRVDKLKKAIESVIEQTFSNFELIIIDNYSIDSTEELIANYDDKRIRYFKYKNNGVISASLNFGLEKSRGRYIAILDSDDFWYRDKLKISLEALEKGFDFVYHDLKINYSKKFIIFKSQIARSRRLGNNLYTDLLINGNGINNSSVVIRKDILDKIGGFYQNNYIIGASDYMTWLCLSKATQKFQRINQILGCISIDSSNMSSCNLQINELPRIREAFQEELNRIGIRHPFWIARSLSRSFFELGLYRKGLSEIANYLRTSFRYSDTPRIIYLVVINFFFFIRNILLNTKN